MKLIFPCERQLKANNYFHCPTLVEVDRSGRMIQRNTVTASGLRLRNLMTDFLTLKQENINKNVLFAFLSGN
jgi:hypothetical protein